MSTSSFSRNRTTYRAVLNATIALFSIMAFGGWMSSAGAQGPTGHRSMASRADLERAVEAAEQVAKSTNDKDLRQRKQSEAQAIRARLAEGDFQPGHRVFLSVLTDSALTDTFTVRSDRKLRLPNLPDISLVGVLDSELEGYLTKEIAKYVKDPEVQANGLLRVSVLGAVGRPGFFSLEMDVLLSDAIMTAGGPVSTADLRKLEIRRGGRVVVDDDASKEALRLGLTLSDMGLRSGDEIYVPDKSSNKWGTLARGLAATAGIAASIFWAVRSL